MCCGKLHEIDFLFSNSTFYSGVGHHRSYFLAAYMTETFRGASLAVDTARYEAARVMGFHAAYFRRLYFRKMLRPCPTGIGQTNLAGIAENHRVGTIIA